MWLPECNASVLKNKNSSLLFYFDRKFVSEINNWEAHLDFNLLETLNAKFSLEMLGFHKF